MLSGLSSTGFFKSILISKWQNVMKTDELLNLVLKKNKN